MTGKVFKDISDYDIEVRKLIPQTLNKEMLERILAEDNDGS